VLFILYVYCYLFSKCSAIYSLSVLLYIFYKCSAIYSISVELFIRNQVFVVIIGKKLELVQVRALVRNNCNTYSVNLL